MRKCRVWDNLRKEYLSAGTISIEIHRGKNPIIKLILDKVMDVTNDKRFLIEYSSGLSDKNENEIYEGDIIAPDKYLNLSGYRVLVEFKNGMYCLKPNNLFIIKREPLQIHLKRADKAMNSYIIIGNKNKNPELVRIDKNDN